MRPLNMSEIDFLRAEIARLQSGQRSSVDTRSDNTAELEALRDGVTARNREIETLNQQITDLRSENVEMQRRLQELESTQRSW